MLDFNDVKPSKSFRLIPANTYALGRLEIIPGNYTNFSLGCPDSLAWRSEATGAIYLKCKLNILRGDYQGHQVFFLIGLYSQKSSTWYEMGKRLICEILNSAHGLEADDKSERATKHRMIKSLQDLHGLEFVAQIIQERAMNDELKNTLKRAIGPENPQYSKNLPPNVKANQADLPEDMDSLPF